VATPIGPRALLGDLLWRRLARNRRRDAGPRQALRRADQPQELGHHGRLQRDDGVLVNHRPAAQLTQLHEVGLHFGPRAVQGGHHLLQRVALQRGQLGPLLQPLHPTAVCRVQDHQEDQQPRRLEIERHAATLRRCERCGLPATRRTKDLT